ncbi:sterol desaturase family protein [Methylicorpusculum oleiharenae]|uniref:sterol desaturase family protein n=1 Tax=Methylicorpusculum oleiharenae TaxID=1338687 RepID=UPI0013598CDF|nr:sterol desaturase family protein [Methylicorpusculum oleiharenae]MCD2449471.1 sterol desaturase family protein [Methylicorpusculum oleiharenae]
METLIRLTAALSIFGVMVFWEYLKPRRILPVERLVRWPINLGLAVINMLMMRLTVGSAAYLAAVNAEENHWGLLNRFNMPESLNIIISLLILDFAIYGQHVLSHKWPLLWRLHQVHHSDLAFDATTAVRFHPLEILFSMFYKVAFIYLIGADAFAVILFEIILNGAATFNHSNISIPDTLDKKLRFLIVTPDMHRIHHSTIKTETDSNYGFSITCWDWLCGTYKAHPKYSQEQMPIGLDCYRDKKTLGFLSLCLMPFRAPLK